MVSLENGAIQINSITAVDYLSRFKFIKICRKIGLSTKRKCFSWRNFRADNKYSYKWREFANFNCFKKTPCCKLEVYASIKKVVADGTYKVMFDRLVKSCVERALELGKY